MKLFSSRFVCVCAFAIVSTRVHCASVDTLTEQIHVFGRKKNRIGGKMLKQRQQQQNTNKLNQTKYSSVQGCQHLCSFSVLRCRLYVIAIRHLSNENVASRINRIRFHERPYALERQLKWTTGWKRSGAHDAVSGVYGIGCLRITIFQLTKKRDILYVSHTKVTYETEQNGTKRNISVCRCTVKRSMLSCFPFMICTNKSDSINSRSSNSSRSSSLYIKLDEQKKASNEKNAEFYFHGGWKNGTHELQINSFDVESNEMQSDGKKIATEEREKKSYFPMAKTQNYVYYSIGRAHFAIHGRKTTTVPKNGEENADTTLN